MKRNRRRYLGKGILGYARYMKFKHELNITQSNYVIQRRLDAIVFYEDFGIKATLGAFKISRRTLFRWRSRYIKSKRRITALIPGSTKPTRTRRMNTNTLILEFIKKIREVHPRIGKGKIKVILDAYCEKTDIDKISESLIGKIIQRNNWYYYRSNKIYHNPNHKHNNGGRKKKRISTEFKPKRPGELIQIDTIVKFDYTVKRYTLTAIDVYSRFGFALTYKSLSSKIALDFYQRLEHVFPGTLENIKTDNGLEFHGNFDDYLERNKINHYWSYPRSPKSNAYVERFNRTLQEEFMDMNLEYITDTNTFNDKLIEYLIYYNSVRPHYGIKKLTPLGYINSRNLSMKECHMCVTSTSY